MKVRSASIFPYCVVLLLAVTGCSHAPIPASDLDADDYQWTMNAAEDFRSDERLQSYFDQSVAYAVFPMSFRAGSGFGGAYGKGWIFRNGETLPINKISMVQLSAGPQLGFQFYQQILFFRTEESLAIFQKNTFEFAGQFNLALLLWGGAGTPSYNESVALFTSLQGGLLLEASISTHRYDVRPIVVSNSDTVESGNSGM